IDIPIVLPSGFGIPLKKFEKVTKKEFFEMTLKREEWNVVGLGKFLNSLKKDLNAYCIPSVKLLPTVPTHRKLNKIDLGTSDKVCSVAHALSNFTEYEEGNFLLIELGYAFTAIVVVNGGKIIDGIGGTNILGGKSRGAIDGELCYLFEFRKEDIYSGGFLDLEERFGMGLKAFREELEKKLTMLLKFHNIKKIFTSGRRNNILSEMDFEFYNLELAEFGASIGAAMIANGLEGGVYKCLVEHLEIRKARERVFDWILSPHGKPRGHV
ncbi:MAG: DUF1464 family protein, partial [Candidatus Methanofastidiosia archaeon]